MLNRLKQRFLSDPGAQDWSGAQDPSGPPTGETAKALDQLRTSGYCILSRVLSPAQCEAISASFEAYVHANQDEARAHTLATRRHSRLCNLHLASAAAREAIAQPRVMEVLDGFFGAPAFVVTSLYFEQSSEQAIHRDTPFFNTQPPDLYAGIWFALEDVHADAGPLRFFPGGHRLPVPVGKVENAAGIGPAWSAYCDRMLIDLRAQGYPEQTALLRQGDCFIWHPELPHGGSPITSPGKTRRSIVFHCASERAGVYGVEEFFGLHPYEPRHPHLVSLNGCRRMLHHPRPNFATNG